MNDACRSGDHRNGRWSGRLRTAGDAHGTRGVGEPDPAVSSEARRRVAFERVGALRRLSVGPGGPSAGAGDRFSAVLRNGGRAALPALAADLHASRHAPFNQAFVAVVRAMAGVHGNVRRVLRNGVAAGGPRGGARARVFGLHSVCGRVFRKRHLAQIDLFYAGTHPVRDSFRVCLSERGPGRPGNGVGANAHQFRDALGGGRCVRSTVDQSPCLPPVQDVGLCGISICGRSELLQWVAVGGGSVCGRGSPGVLEKLYGYSQGCRKAVLKESRHISDCDRLGGMGCDRSVFVQRSRRVARG